MITIGMLGAWFLLSGVIFGVLNYVLEGIFDTQRSANTSGVLFAQGLAALLLSLVHAYAVY